MALLRAQGSNHPGPVNAIVNDGSIALWGAIDSESERTVICVAAEATPGARTVNNHMIVRLLL